MPHDDQTVAENVRLAGQLGRWLDKIDAASTGAAVDLADTIAAGRHVERLVRHLITLDPTNPADADEALSTLARLHAWLLTELRWHVEHLAEVWETLEDCVAAFAPEDDDDPDEDDDSPHAA